MKPIMTSDLNFRTRSWGFTMIEMMTVLIILSIMSVFAFNYYNRQQEKANLKIAITMLSTYAQELTAFKLKNGFLPENNSEFSRFEEQFYFNPNQDPHLGAYFQVKPDWREMSLVTIPQKKHRFKSYAKMSLNDFSIAVCRPKNDIRGENHDNCRQMIDKNMYHTLSALPTILRDIPTTLIKGASPTPALIPLKWAAYFRT